MNVQFVFVFMLTCKSRAFDFNNKLYIRQHVGGKEPDQILCAKKNFYIIY